MAIILPKSSQHYVKQGLLLKRYMSGCIRKSSRVWAFGGAFMGSNSPLPSQNEWNIQDFSPVIR
jgi:hypothetical protein